MLQYHKIMEKSFQKIRKIVALSSQVETSLITVDDLLQAEKIGESRFKEFLKIALKPTMSTSMHQLKSWSYVHLTKDQHLRRLK